jgi:tetratricopeptide (TPR) repeat protein
MAGQAWKARQSGKAQGPERLRLTHFTMQDGRSAHPFETIDHYREQIERHPQSAEPHLRLGNVLRMLGRWDKATAEYERALALDPGDASPLAAQAEMEVLRNNPERALELFEAYLERTPVRPQNREDAELWDGAHESIGYLQSSAQSAVRALSTVARVRTEAASQRTDQASGPQTPGMRPESSSQRQARKKKKAKRKAARKARQRK